MGELARTGTPRDDATAGALAAPGTRVLLTGTGSHATGSALPPVAAVAPTVVALGQVLVEQCGADRTHRRIRPISAGSSPAHDIAFSPDGRTLAVGSTDFVVRMFDVRTRTLTAVLNEHTDVVNGVAFSPGGQTLASASGDDYTLLWTLDPRAAVRRLCQAVQGPSLAKQWADLPASAGLGPLPCPS